MPKFREKNRFFCRKCGCEREWRIEHRLINYHPITHCFVCEECGEEVPDFALHGYLTDGRVVIPV